MHDMTNISDEDKFEYWLMDMDDAIERFITSLPGELSSKLNFSAQSLVELESFILERYEDIGSVRDAKEAQFVDGASRYVGEVFRKYLGGKWGIELKNSKNAFYGVPQLIEFKGQITQLCPQKMITAAVGRRTGHFIEQILQNNMDCPV